MSLYVDGSILPKLLRHEPESRRVQEIFAGEAQLIISALTRLETLVVIDSWIAGGLAKAEGAARRKALEHLHSAPNVVRRSCRTAIFEIAEAQLASAYCPTLDRLHLAVMEDLNLRRLFTNDDQQADSARALGYEVILPR
jgi:uncharacterized protein with PIN domain